MVHGKRVDGKLGGNKNVRVNFTTTEPCSGENPGIMVSKAKGNHPKMAASFRLVKY